MLAEFDEGFNELLNSLQDDETRQIVLLRMEGYTNPEIAEQMGIALRKVERRLKSARERLGSDKDTAPEATSKGKNLASLLRKANDGDETARNGIDSIAKIEMERIGVQLKRSKCLKVSALARETRDRLIRLTSVDGFQRQLSSVVSRLIRNSLADGRTRRDNQIWLELVQQFESHHGISVLALENALKRLGQESPQQQEIVELRFFTGMSIPQTAELLACETESVESQWKLARAKLYRWLKAGE